MVYDEGFEIKIGTSVFFAFSKYKSTSGYHTPTDEDDEQTKGYQSLCDETFMGWHFDTANKLWSCFSGKKKLKIIEKKNVLDKIQGEHLKIV